MNIEDIKQRLEAATPGPWVMRIDGDRYLEAPNAGPGALMCDTQYYPWTFDRQEDWEFVAHAPEDIKYLLEKLELPRNH